MESDIYEDTGKLVKLLKNEFREVNVDIEIIHDHYTGINEYRVSGCIDLGMFNFSIGSDTFSLSHSFNPYSFTMSMYHPTPVRINTSEARDRLVTTIQKTIKILREKNPWAIVES